MSYDNYNFWDEINITKGEHNVIKHFSSHKEILIPESDKSNSAVVLNRHDYITRINEMLYDTSKFRNIDIKSAKEIDYMF